MPGGRGIRQGCNMLGRSISNHPSMRAQGKWEKDEKASERVKHHPPTCYFIPHPTKRAEENRKVLTNGKNNCKKMKLALILTPDTCLTVV
jgi:hypothetical protein